MSRVYEWLTARPGWMLSTASIIYLLLGWGQDGINLDSATYAVIARNMAEFGQWFNPHYTAYYHSAFAEHPPLVMWLQGLIFLILTPNDSTARLVGALTTLGSIIVVYRIGREIMGRTYGFLSGLILLLTYNFIQIGNSTLLDVPMTFFVLLALWGMVKMLRQGVTASSALLTGFALGLAWLAKGVVSGPVWIALTLTCLIFNRQWLRKKEFWLAPLVAVGIMAGHLILDQAFASGRFTEHYFLRQISRTFLGRTPVTDTAWWEFSYRIATLYLPFILLFPFGVYYAIRKRVNALYPVLITFAFYALFYSVAAKLYYHYFCPVYALAAPFAALPLALWLKESHVKKIAAVFMALWVVAAGIVLFGNVRVHEIRTTEIYVLNDGMNSVLKRMPARDGVCIGHHPPNWDHIAKAAWYWRSDIRQTHTVKGAVGLLESGDYSYLIVEKSDKTTRNEINRDFSDQLTTLMINDEVKIFIHAGDLDIQAD